MNGSRSVWMAVGGAALGVLIAASVGGAARGCGTRGRVVALEQRVDRVEVALGIGDAGAVPSADGPTTRASSDVAAKDAGAAAAGSAMAASAPVAPPAPVRAQNERDLSPECAVSKVAAYRAWQEAVAKAKTLARPAEAACSDVWSDKKKQACYAAASAEMRAAERARDTIIAGGQEAREAVKKVKDDPKNDGLAGARAASDKVFASCGVD